MSTNALNKNSKAGVSVAIGIAVGTAVGVALEHLALGVAGGVAAGGLIAFVMHFMYKKKRGDRA